MYVPQHFQQADLAQLHDFIEGNSFGLLASQQDGDLQASHLPMLLDRRTGQNGELIGHMARANRQWEQADGQPVLAIFSGPHAYISPEWYESEHVVPTWNYAAVHAYGPFQAIHDPHTLTEIVRAYVDEYERSRPKPWKLERSPQFIERMVAQIVGFRIPVERLEGKWKLNQNHPRERREKVIRALQSRGDENALAIAELIRQTLDG